jgi:hypothetical protein
MAEIGDEGNDLFGFVGVDTNFLVCRLTPQSFQKPIRINTSNLVNTSTYDTRSKTVAGLPITDNRVIRGHFQVVLAIAYRRNYQQVVTSSGDGATLVWSPEMDEILPDEKRAEVEALYRDDYSDED